MHLHYSSMWVTNQILTFQQLEAMTHNRRKPKMTFENNTSSRPRKKFCFLFFVLFFFWYSSLYGFDWSSLPGLSSASRHQPQNPSSNNAVTISSHNSSQSSDFISISVNHNLDTTDQTSNGTSKQAKPSLPREEEDQGIEKRACKGRYIYVHDLPSRFNSDYITHCNLINKWHDMCPYFANGGLGQTLGNPQNLFQPSGWYVTHQFSLDVIFHSRMQMYDCLTDDSSKASAIYVPYYAGLDVSRFLWDTYNASVKDADLTDLFTLLRSRPEWGVMGGRDHFVVSGRITWDLRRLGYGDLEWGNRLMVAPESQNMTMVTIESSPWHSNDFAIPYPTYFHPLSEEQVREWQRRMRRQKRRSLFCFAGAPRPNMEESIRGEIMRQCRVGRRCRMVECKDEKKNCLQPANVMRMFQGSVFCLQPSGDSFTRRSTFDSIVAGCIPVFFTPGSAYVQYLWHLPRDFGSYSVLIPEGDVKGHKVSIEGVLGRIPASRVAAMRERVIRLIPKVIYADHRSKLGGMEDAFDLAIRGVVQRVDGVRREMKEGRNSSAELSWKYYALGTTQKHEWDSYFKRYISVPPVCSQMSKTIKKWSLTSNQSNKYIARYFGR